MGTADRRGLRLLPLLLTGLLVGLPWTTGGRSPEGQLLLVALPCLGFGAALWLPRRRPLPVPARFLGGAALLVGVACLDTLHPDRSVQAVLRLAAYGLVAALAARVARDLPAGETALLRALAGSGALVAAAAVGALLAGGESGIYAAMATGPFAYPNALAGFLLLGLGGALGLVRGGGTGRGARLGAAAAGLLMLLGLGLTRSRGALLAAAVAAALWVCLDRPRWAAPPRRWAWGLLLAGLGLAAAALPRWIGLLRPLLGPEPLEGLDPSLAWRLYILRWTWRMIRDHPWTGVGPGGYPVALTHYQGLPYIGGENPHNLYLEVAAEYGLPLLLLLLVGLGGLAARLWRARAALPVEAPERLRLQAVGAGLAAFLLHSAVDLDWSFPAVAVAAALCLGLLVARAGGGRPRRRPRATRIAGTLLLLGLLLCTLGRYAATLLVAEGQAALAAGQPAAAADRLGLALRLNPLGFAAHQWRARALLGAGEGAEATATATRLLRLLPEDPNSHALAGEVALGRGRLRAAEAHFAQAVELAPLSHLRYHAGAVESAARAGREAEARWLFGRALTRFPPERVLSQEARCLAPGDRYLLARMARLAASPPADAGGPEALRGAAGLAERLEAPDPRGICAVQGPPERRSPEAALGAYWRARGEGGWDAAAAYLLPELRTRQARGPALPRAELTRIAALTGWEREVAVEYELRLQAPGGRPASLCAHTPLRLTPAGWLLSGPPSIAHAPCQP